ncbi:MAG: thiamine phosphate synthase [Acidobacteria bacterium]|nr:thiamine phosphate synthase [Acidobacteriota bacterium]
MHLPTPIVCVITRARGVPGSPERAALVSRMALAAAAGASMIQVRERQLDDRACVDFTRELIDATTGTPCVVTVNDRPDIAVAAGAAGAHLKSDGVSAADVRSIAPANFLVGRSVHSLPEAVAAEREGGYDYLVFGTVFPTASKPADHAIAGIEALQAVCAGVSLPVLAIGGVTPSRAAQAARAGAAGVAAVSLFAEARDIAEAVSSLRALTGHSRRV